MRLELTVPSAMADSSWLQAARTRVARIWDGYSEGRRRRATVRILQSLDSRILHDIGLSRSEIPSAVHDTSGDRLRRYDKTWD